MQSHYPLPFSSSSRGAPLISLSAPTLPNPFTLPFCLDIFALLLPFNSGGPRADVPRSAVKDKRIRSQVFTAIGGDGSVTSELLYNSLHDPHLQEHFYKKPSVRYVLFTIYIYVCVCLCVCVVCVKRRIEAPYVFFEPRRTLRVPFKFYTLTSAIPMPLYPYAYKKGSFDQPRDCDG